MPPKAETKLNLNTVLLVLSILGGLGTVLKFLLPLAVVPEKMGRMESSVQTIRSDVDDTKRTQAVQTDALQRLAKVAEDSATTRRDVDKVATEVQEVKRRLERLEEK